MRKKGATRRLKPAVRSIERVSLLPAALDAGGEQSRMPEFRTYWQILRNHRWTVAAILVVVFVGVLIGTLAMTPVYRASGTLEIGPEHPDIVPVEDLFRVEKESDVYLQTQFEVLRSAVLSQRVISELRLAEAPEFNPPKSWWNRALSSEPRSPAAVRQGVLNRFQDRLDIRPRVGSRLVTVGFDSYEPKRAADVVNALLSGYIDMRVESGRRASGWLSEQLAGTKEKLEASEKEFHTYARNNRLLFLEDDKGNTENIVNQRLRQMQEELTRAQAGRFEKEALYKLVQNGDYGSLPGVGEDKLLQDLSLRLADLKREYAQLAATFTPDYPKVKQVKYQVDELEAALAREHKRAAEQITNEYIAARRQEELLLQAFQEQQTSADGIRERLSRYNILKREVDTNKQLYDILQQKLKETGVSAALKAGNIQILDLAVPPLTPDRPKLALNLAMAFVVGLALGVGAAFLREHLDTTLRTPDEVGRFLGVPALAMIPSVESLNDQRSHGNAIVSIRPRLSQLIRKAPTALADQWHRIDTNGQQHSALAEAFGCLRTSILLSSDSPPPRCLLISSSQPGEGKTTVAVNLSISLAQLGKRVLLVDADIRRPSVDKALQLGNTAGLVEYLTDDVDWMTLAQPTRVNGLLVLTGGGPAPNPAELLSSFRMQDLLTQALLECDFVILDSPALLINAPDARILATLAQGVVLVIRSGFTTSDAVQHARSQVPNVIGVVLNQLGVEHLPSYYRSYYGPRVKDIDASEVAGPVPTPEKEWQESSAGEISREE